MEDFSALREKALSVLKGDETFWALIKFIPDAVIAHNKNKNIYVNPAAIELFGAEDENGLLGQDLLDFTHQDERAEVIKRRSEAASNAQLGGTATRTNCAWTVLHFTLKIHS